MHDVQIGQARFHHHHVGALGEVERHFAQRFVRVRRILLIGFLVALQRRRRADGLAVRPVEPARILGGIGEDHRVGEALLLEGEADGANAPVHHVRRRDHIRARADMHQRLRDEALHRGIIRDRAILVQKAVMAVARIGIQRNVRDQTNFRRGILHGFQRARHEAVRRERARALGVLALRPDIREQRDRRNAQRLGPLRRPRGFLHAQSVHARQRGDRHPALPIMHEHRPDQIGRGQHVFSGQRTHPWGLAQAAHSCGGKGLGKLGHGVLLRQFLPTHNHPDFRRMKQRFVTSITSACRASMSSIQSVICLRGSSRKPSVR